MTKTYVDKLCYRVVGCAIEVHKALGPGLLESVYERCFIRELELNELNFRSQVAVPVSYKGVLLDVNYRVDVLVEEILVVELKAVDSLLPVHTAQLLTYMKLLEKPKGVILNFNCANIFKEGQRTMINEYFRRLEP